MKLRKKLRMWRDGQPTFLPTTPSWEPTSMDSKELLIQPPCLQKATTEKLVVDLPFLQAGNRLSCLAKRLHYQQAHILLKHLLIMVAMLQLPLRSWHGFQMQAHLRSRLLPLILPTPGLWTRSPLPSTLLPRARYSLVWRRQQVVLPILPSWWLTMFRFSVRMLLPTSRS